MNLIAKSNDLKEIKEAIAEHYGVKSVTLKAEKNTLLMGVFNGKKEVKTAVVTKSRKANLEEYSFFSSEESKAE